MGSVFAAEKIGFLENEAAIAYGKSRYFYGRKGGEVQWRVFFAMKS